MPSPAPSINGPAHRRHRTLVWDWDIDQEDRAREAAADTTDSEPFQIDRRVLRDVVKEKMAADVARITFISSGTFHKAYLVTLTNAHELVARVARRFMPRLKTESEVATLNYLRSHTSIPVPTVYHYDASPYNRLGGEYILMSKAPGVPLAKVYHSLPHDTLAALLKNLATLLIPLFGHRFTHIGSLYAGPGHDTEPSTSTSAFGSSLPTPTLSTASFVYPLTPMNERRALDFPTPHPSCSPHTYPHTHTLKCTPVDTDVYVGPIISWPFFGSSRGELAHPHELNRGPWHTTAEYHFACAQREVDGVRRENEGRSKPHRLHLDPDDVVPRLGVGGHFHGNDDDDDDDGDDKDAEGRGWDGVSEQSFGSDSDEDVMYRDYRKFQRSTFLVAALVRREEQAAHEMERFMRCMEGLEAELHAALEADGVLPSQPAVGDGEFGLDCHDLSLENVFVDEHDHAQITCIIDWESTTTRPLWACAHLPSFLLASPGAAAAQIFRGAVAALPAHAFPHARAWVAHEARGARLRYAHKCVEWDGWEEGLVGEILGGLDTEAAAVAAEGEGVSSGSGSGGGLKVKPRTLDALGDECGGRGGELGRRLEAWLSGSEGSLTLEEDDPDREADKMRRFE